jgi:IS30 family transposase
MTKTRFGYFPDSKHDIEKRRADVIAMYEAGFTLRHIAAAIGRRHQTVHGILRRAGITLRPRGGNSGSHSRHAL